MSEAEANEMLAEELEAEEGNAVLEAEETAAEETTADETVETFENGSEVVSLIEAKLAERDAQAKEYLDRLQRTMAEFDNFRKRTVKEKSSMYENGAREVLEKLLPVIDNFQRAIGSIKEEEKESSLAQGIDMIYKQFKNVLTDIGVEEIAAKGTEFDPNLHHAVAHEENEAYGENEVVDVLQTGYTYKERVVRCAMVKVAN